MLRLVRALPDPQIGTVAALGVDDFALRRGHVYGTVLVNMRTHRPIDLLADRQADTFAAWLREHPGTEVICRDRGGGYAEGARQGAPDAIQVADRWHLWHNLCEHVEKTVLRHRADLPEPIPDDPPGGRPDRDDPTNSRRRRRCPEKAIVTRTKQRYAAVQELYARGVSLSSIALTFELDVHTVRRFAHASGLDELLIKTLQRASLLDEFKPYLHQRGPGLHRRRPPRRTDQHPGLPRQRPDRAPLPAPVPRPAGPSHRRARPHRPSARSPAGSCDDPTASMRRNN